MKLLFATLSLLLISTPALHAAPTSRSEALPSTPAPKIVDLRTQFSQWGLPIKDQGRRDTCAVFTFTGVLEYAIARGTGERGVRLSEEYLNWAANQASGD